MKRLVPILFLFAASCSGPDEGAHRLSLFTGYFAALQADSPAKWQYTADTLRLWFDDKSGEPVLQLRGRVHAGKWSAWDREMNASSGYDSLWYDGGEQAVKGYFYENNDFYELIGKGPTRTLRSYWFNDANKISEVLIYWIPEENTETAVHLQPVVTWAMEKDSAEINALYPDGQLVPSAENARRWRHLLQRYRADTAAATNP